MNNKLIYTPQLRSKSYFNNLKELEKCAVIIDSNPNSWNKISAFLKNKVITISINK